MGWGALKGSGDLPGRLLTALVHQLLEVGAGTELRYPRLGHLDERASGRVPRRTRRLVHHLERTEADYRHLVAGGHRLLHRLDDRVDRLRRRLVAAHARGDGLHEFLRVHDLLVAFVIY